MYDTVTYERPIFVKSVGQALYLSAITLAGAGFGDVSPAAWWAKLCACVEALLGLVLTALFLVAIVRKTIRD